MFHIIITTLIIINALGGHPFGHGFNPFGHGGGGGGGGPFSFKFHF